MEEIQALKGAPEKFDSLLADENYLDATRLIVKSLAYLNRELSGVEGLVEIKAVLEKKNEKLFTTILDRLGSVLYKEVQSEILAWHVTGGGGGMGANAAARNSFRRVGSSSNRSKEGGGGGGAAGGQPPLGECD